MTVYTSPGLLTVDQEADIISTLVRYLVAPRWENSKRVTQSAAERCQSHLAVGSLHCLQPCFKSAGGIGTLITVSNWSVIIQISAYLSMCQSVIISSPISSTLLKQGHKHWRRATIMMMIHSTDAVSESYSATTAAFQRRGQRQRGALGSRWPPPPPPGRR